ncbi:hypothetical protein GTY23_41470 [Streptomyces sp. SID5998]|nr:hypothetical protein [Streptomyces sp. SID5998]
MTMTHPGVEQPIEVDEVSVPHYQASGWQVADPQEQKPAAKVRRTQKGHEG